MSQRLFTFGTIQIFLECDPTVWTPVYHFDLIVEVVVVVQLKKRPAVLRVELLVIILVTLAHEQW